MLDGGAPGEENYSLSHDCYQKMLPSSTGCEWEAVTAPAGTCGMVLS